MAKALITILSAVAVLSLAGFDGPGQTVCALVSQNGTAYQKDTSRYVFVGAETCAGKCHNNKDMGFQYDIWKGSPHARSFLALSTDKAEEYAAAAGQRGDPSENILCLKCHVTASEADPSSLSATYRREDGVTCEACHKAEFRPKTYLPGEQECLECHNSAVHPVQEFDFQSRYGIIRHKRPGNHPE